MTAAMANVSSSEKRIYIMLSVSVPKIPKHDITRALMMKTIKYTYPIKVLIYQYIAAGYCAFIKRSGMKFRKDQLVISWS